MGIQLLIAVSIALTTIVTSQICGPTLTWTTSNGQIMLNGQPFVLKGVNYFGFETGTYAPHGLWSYPLSFFLNFIKSNGFNAIRLPFSQYLALNNPSGPNVDCGSNPTICHLNALDLMNAFIDQAGQLGLLVMLDSHVNDPNAGITELWYDNSQYPESTVLQGWGNILARFATKWNVFALDLKNEPHGAASWGQNNNATDWNLAAARFINYFNTNYPQYNGLFFVEGVQQNVAAPNTNIPNCFWGENLGGVQWNPINTGNAALNNRVVYSPHVYGPDVYGQSYFSDGTFPANMPSIWNQQFGYAQSFTGNPVVTGEWGGFYRSGTSDETWANAYSQWMISNCQTNNFYWCLNPDSGDTGGLLQSDWQTPDTRKLALLSNTQPNPTTFSLSGSNICVTAGKFPNANCAGSATTTAAGTTTTVGLTTTTTISPTTTAAPTTTTATTTTTTAPTTTKSATTTSVVSTTKATTTQAPTTTTGATGSGHLQISTQIVNSWPVNGQTAYQVNINILNTGSVAICGGVVNIMLDSSTTIQQIWNLNLVNGNQYSFPSWVNIAPGATWTPGMIVYGNVPPVVEVSEVACSG